MLKKPKHAVPLIALASVITLATAAVSIAAIEKRFAVANTGVQKGVTIMGAKNTPKRMPTHSMGAIHKTEAMMSIGQHLRPPAMVASGMGRLEGVEKQGAKGTPKRTPRVSVTQSSEAPR